jgi:hypothetical protein
MYIFPNYNLNDKKEEKVIYLKGEYTTSNIRVFGRFKKEKPLRCSTYLYPG